MLPESPDVAESLPLRGIRYPETDGTPMPDADYQGRAYCYAVEALRAHFRDSTDIYVSGDLFIYLEEGKPEHCIAPDVFVVLGAGNHMRNTYKLWEEPGGAPDFVLEIVSPSTWRADLGAKRALYASLGVGEYWLHDPHGRHLHPALAGHRLVDGRYAPLPATVLPGGPAIHSDTLALELRLDGERLRFFDPTVEEYLPDLVEAMVDRRRYEAERAAAESARAAAETARVAAETARVEAEERLRASEAAATQHARKTEAAEARIAELERLLRTRSESRSE